MSLNLFRPFAHDPFFENAFGNEGAMINRTNSHPISIDVRETDKAFVMSAEVAGVKSEDIHLTTEDNLLTLKIERSNENKGEEEDGKLVWSERSYGSFTRTLNIPDNCDKDKIEAKQVDGVLEVIIPKNPPQEPKSKVQRIAITKH